MAGYIIVQVDVEDADAYETYKPQVPPTLEAYGGEYVVRGAPFEVFEGEWPIPRLVVLRFPSVEKARAWYESEEYAAPKAIRQGSAKTNMIMVEGA